MFGYVKVVVRSRSPKLWGWNLHRSGCDAIFQRSEAHFRSAEDAWAEGHRVLSAFDFKQAARQPKLDRAA